MGGAAQMMLGKTAVGGSALQMNAPANVYKLGSTATITSDPLGGSASGGTAPYSYQITKLSGSAAVNADTPGPSAGAANSTFTGTTMASGNLKSAIFRITVTDNVAATAYADVQVDIERT